MTITDAIATATRYAAMDGAPVCIVPARTGYALAWMPDATYLTRWVTVDPDGTLTLMVTTPAGVVRQPFTLTA